MRQLLLLFIFSISFSVTAQQFLDKEFYLVDSIKLDDLSESEVILIDSLLELYHDKESVIDQLEILDQLVIDLKNDNVWPRYNDLMLKLSYNNMFASSFVQKDRDICRRIFAQGISGLGQVEISRGNLIKSLDYFFTSLEFFKDVGSKEDYAGVYSNIGTCYFHQAELDQAEHYLQLCNDSLTGSENFELVALSLNNMAVICQEKKDLDKALMYHYKSLDLCLSQGNMLGAAMSYNNIGGIYSQYYTDSLHKGEQYLKKALQIFKDRRADDWTALTYNKLALTQLKLNQYEKSEMNANFSLFFAQQSKQSQPLLRAFRTLYKVKRQIGKPNEALTYYERFVEVKDSIYNSALKVETAAKELEYQYKADKELAQKENEKRLALEKSERQKQENINYWITAFICLTLIFAVVQLFRNRKIKKQSELIEKQSEERKILLKEIHHRVKNNFQIICSVLRLQAYDEENPIVDRAFEDAVNRIQSMAEVHEMIYKEESFSTIDPVTYFNRLTSTIQHLSYDRQIDYLITSEVAKLSMEVMISLGISVNELITNSIKHAFTDQEINPKVEIKLLRENDFVILSYTDNGVGYKSEEINESFGTELIKTIIEQINGELIQENSEKGSAVKIRFKV